MSLVSKYQANPIEAVKVTKTNKQAIAKWADGSIGEKDDLHIKIGHGRTEREVLARVDHWVIKEYSGSFRVFNDKAFSRIFNLVDAPQLPIEMYGV